MNDATGGAAPAIAADDKPWNATQVAGALGKSLDWFYRHRKALMTKGFPAPLPGCGNRWLPEAVRAWKKAPYAELLKAAPAQDMTNIVGLQAARAERGRKLAETSH